MEPTEKPPPVSTKRRAWLKRLFSPGETLSQRVVRGGLWVFALRIVTRLFGLVRTIILARLLAPEDFGLFGIALLTMSALETFSQTGFQAALIQKKEDIGPYLDTAWTLQAIRGAVLASILFGIGPYVAAFFATPAAAALVRVLGISVLFQGFTNIGVVYFQKQLDFHKQFAYQLGGTLADLLVAITAAILLRNAWALVFGLLAGTFARMGVSYLIHPYRPRFRLEGAKARELYSFGRWILSGSVLSFLFTQGDDALVGKVLGVTALGFYQMAYRVSNLPATEITHVVSQVSFPAYSKLQDDLMKLREAFLGTIQITALISLPLAGGIFALAPDFARIFLGERWMPMVPPMQVLTLFGAARSISYGSLYTSVGKPQVLTKIIAGKLLILSVIIYPLTTMWGILGTAVGVLISDLVLEIYAARQAIIIVRSNARSFCRIVGVPAFATLAMTASLAAAKTLLIRSHDISLVEFFILMIGGILIYALLVYLVDRKHVLALRERVLTVLQYDNALSEAGIDDGQ